MEDEGRLLLFKDDKLKDTENSPFVASSVLVVKAKQIKPATIKEMEIRTYSLWNMM